MAIIRGNSKKNTLVGTSAHDYLYGYESNDVLYGRNGNDRLYGGAGNDRLYGETGNDSLYGGTGVDTMYGGSGNDLLVGEDGNDVVLGDQGNDRLYGGNGNDHLFGIDGNDTAYGGAGNDQIDGDDGNDVLYGDDGIDYLHGNAGNDYLNGGAGNDYLEGGDGFDTIWGGAGIDILSFDAETVGVVINLETGATLGDEVHEVENILGSQAGDDLTGSSIANVIDGFLGQDTMTGLGGDDVFIVHDGKTIDVGGTDTITDFVQGQDKIGLALSEVPFSSLIESGPSQNLFNVAGPPAAATGINGAQIIYDTVNGFLYYDNDGDDLVAPVHIATLTDFSGSLHGADFSILDSIRSY